MTYQKNESYTRAVEKAATAAHLEFRLITHYLDWADLAAFRIATDILVHLPISDALSATVLEVIYGGNCVITGLWLPYGPFRRALLPLVTVEDFSEIAACPFQDLPPSCRTKTSSIGSSPTDTRTFFCRGGCATLGGNLLRSS